jgi:toxin ParE1/3/4
MKEFSLIITKKAEIDLADIWDSIAVENLVAADKFARTLQSRINQLKHFPQLGASRSDINIKYRQLVEGRYLILYKCMKAQQTVEIIRVIHSARDVRQIF